MLDLSHLPAVDVHCHPFLNRGPITAEQLTDLAAFPGGNTRGYMEQGGVAWDDTLADELQQVQRNTIYFKRFVRDLALFLEVEPELEAVVAARNEAVAAGYTQYVDRMYRSV